MGGAMDYRHVEYVSHGPMSENAAASTVLSAKAFPVPPTALEVVVSQDNAAPLSNQNTAPLSQPPPPSYSRHNDTSAPPANVQVTAAAAVPIIDSPTSLFLQVPRPIPASTALQMIRTFMETIMFMRGQIPTTWQMLQSTLQLERKKMDQPQHSTLSTDVSASSTSPKANQRLIRKLEEFVGPFEEMMTVLGDAVAREQRRRAESRSNEMLVISVAIILGSTFATPKELYRICVGPIQPNSYHRSSLSSSTPLSPSPSILQPTTTTLQNRGSHEDQLSQKEENEWVRRLAQLMITNGYEHAVSTLPRTRVHLVLRAPPGREDEGLVPRQTLVLPNDREDDQRNGEDSSTRHLPPLDSSSMPPPPPPCPSTLRYPVYTCNIMGPTTYQFNHETIYTTEAAPPATSIWYQAGPSLPIPPPNFD